MNELSNKELSGFLHEIDMQESASDSFKIAGITQKEAVKRSIDSRKQKAIDKKVREKEIIQDAINSTFIDLNAQLLVSHKRLLIKLLTDEYTQLMIKQEKYINTKILNLFKLIMPTDLMNAWYKYKESFIPMDGFTYTASKEYGQNLQFKVSLDLPYYFKPEDCQNILLEHWPERCINIDKAIVFFYKYKNTRTTREVKIAQQLTRISTYFQLVKKNPFWYDILAQELKHRFENGQ